MPQPPARPYAPFTSRYGSIGQVGEWKEAIEAYYWDRLPEAFAVARSLGAGFGGASLRWYRMIEGEMLTREQAQVEDLAPWLSLEWAPTEFEATEQQRESITNACRSVAGRLGWNFEMPVRATILLDEVDAPWHGARFGYCVDKYPYDKICIPYQAAHDPHRLEEVVSHEYTHVITLNLTGGRIPHWLDEGLAMLMAGETKGRVMHWQSPTVLNGAFESDRRDEGGLQHATFAYYQAAHLVGHLYRLGGDVKLAQLLRAFTNNSLWTELKINLDIERSIDEALVEVYGFDERHLFEQARV